MPVGITTPLPIHHHGRPPEVVQKATPELSPGLNPQRRRSGTFPVTRVAASATIRLALRRRNSHGFCLPTWPSAVRVAL